MGRIEVAICADANVAVGLHVTLHSTARHLAAGEQLTAHLFLKDYGPAALAALRATLQPFGERVELVVHDAAGVDTGKGRGLHGNKMPYILLRMPELLSAERILCLDADLLVHADLAALYRFDLAGAAAGMVRGTDVRDCWPLERDFLLSIGIPPEAPYFNTGVVLIDRAAWVQHDLTRRSFEFAERHAEHLHTADQTVLNGVGLGLVAQLPVEYNLPSYPQFPASGLESPGIHHFIGSPKPWDLLGEFLHVNYAAFAAELRQTSLRDYRSYKDLSLPRLRRSARLVRSYLRAAQARWRQR